MCGCFDGRQGCVPFTLGRGDDESDTEGSQDEDSTGYQTAPLASVYTIMEQYLAIDNSQGDDAWFAGDNRS